MPRQMRIEYPGAIYHVLSRGDRREAIFLDDGDYHDFIKTLAEACRGLRRPCVRYLSSIFRIKLPRSGKSNHG